MDAKKDKPKRNSLGLSPRRLAADANIPMTAMNTI